MMMPLFLAMIPLVFVEDDRVRTLVHPNLICSESPTTPELGRRVLVFNTESLRQVALVNKDVRGEEILENIPCQPLRPSGGMDVVEDILKCQGENFEIIITSFNGWGSGPYAKVSSVKNGKVANDQRRFGCVTPQS
jgi:hypothetical protein